MKTDDAIDSPLSGVICEKPFLDAVFMFSPTGIALTDLTGKFMDVNEACAQILGYSRSELIGKSFQEITHAEDILYDMRMFNDLLMGNNRTYQMTKRFIRKDGKSVWVRVRVNAVREDGKTTYLVKHIIEMEMSKESSALAVDLLRSKKVKRCFGMAMALLVFCTLSSVTMLLHIFGILPH